MHGVSGAGSVIRVVAQPYAINNPCTNMIKIKPIAALVLVGILVGVAAYHFRKPSGPIYGGRRINNWLDQLNSTAFSDLEKRHEARRLLRTL